MPVYKKSANRWRVCLYQNGMRQDWIVEGTRKEALRFEAAKRVELVGQDPTSAGRIVPTLLDFCAGAYKKHAVAHLKKRTWSNRLYTMATLTSILGKRKLTNLTVAILEDYKNVRLMKVSPSTVNDELKILRAILAYARQLGLPCATPKIKNVPTRGVKKRVFFWTLGEVALVIDAVRRYAPELEGIVVFLLNTGCRKGEALAVEWSWIDLDKGVISIRPNADWQPKDNEPREIPISAALRPYLEGGHASERYVFPAQKRKKKGKRTRFARWPQKAFDRAKNSIGFNAACEECIPANIDPNDNQWHTHAAPVACGRHRLKGGPHTTRHTFAAHFLAARPDMFLLAQLLGHSHTRMTETYSHLLPDHLAQARDVVSLGATKPALSVVK